MNMLRIALLLAIAGFAGFALAGGGDDHTHPEDKKKAAVSSPAAVSPAPTFSAGPGGPLESVQRLPDGALFVPKSAQRALDGGSGLRTEVAKQGEFARVVELPGRVVADPNRGGRVQATQAGRIEAAGKGIAVIGQRVARGQVLALLAPTLDAGSRADKQSALAEISAQEAIAEKRVARLEQLEGSVPKKEVEQARIELESLRARRNAVGTALSGRIALTAPVAGVVAAANVGVGQVVEAKETLFEIVDPQHLAVEALAYDASAVAGFGEASAALPGGALRLAFVGVGRSLKEQALPVLFRVMVPEKDAGPPVAVGQTLKVLASTRERQAGVAVAASAVARNSANETVVWVHEDAERFVARRVRTAPLDAGRVLVSEGLAGGERVVVQGVPALSQIR